MSRHADRFVLTFRVVALENAPPNHSGGAGPVGATPKAIPVETTFGQQFLDIAIAQGDPQIEPDDMPNDLRRELVTGIGNRLYAPALPQRGSHRQSSRDNAVFMTIMTPAIVPYCCLCESPTVKANPVRTLALRGVMKQAVQEPDQEMAPPRPLSGKPAS